MRHKSIFQNVCQLFSSLIIAVACLLFVQNVLGQKIEEGNLSSPQITDVLPKETTPETYIKISGYKLGGIDKSEVIFSQGAENFVMTASGASWEGEDYENALLYWSVKVPKEVAVGDCQITIKFESRQSLPFAIKISSIVKPPEIKSMTPSKVRTGEFVLVDGIGFSEKDKIEILDAEGKIHVLGLFGISNTGELGFTVPDEIADGDAVVKVLETRNGFDEPGNGLPLRIKHGAVPLNLDGDDIVSLASGQWYEPVLWSNNPLVGATKIEFLLRQGKQEQISFVSNFKKIRFQIPTFFTTGRIEVQTRTWINDDISEWSLPISLEVIEKPQSPIIQSLEIVPAKAEAMFKQNGKAVSVLPLYLGVLPRSTIPKEVKDGSLEIFLRFWDSGKFTEWKQYVKYDSFSKTSKTFYFRPEYGEERQLEFNPFYERFYIENKSNEVFEINRGQSLRINGNYFVGSINDLQVTLENAGQTIYLKPTAQEFDGMILVKIPANLLSGDWKFAVLNKDKNIITASPVKLRIK